MIPSTEELAEIRERYGTTVQKFGGREIQWSNADMPSEEVDRLLDYIDTLPSENEELRRIAKAWCPFDLDYDGDNYEP